MTEAPEETPGLFIGGKPARGTGWSRLSAELQPTLVEPRRIGFLERQRPLVGIEEQAPVRLPVDPVNQFAATCRRLAARRKPEPQRGRKAPADSERHRRKRHD